MTLRVATGPYKPHPDHWTGYFIRGDELDMVMWPHSYLRKLLTGEYDMPTDPEIKAGLLKELERQMADFMRVIEPPRNPIDG